MVTLHNNSVLYLSLSLFICNSVLVGTKLISSGHSEQLNVPAVSTAGNVCSRMPLHCCLLAQSFVVVVAAAAVVVVVALLRGRLSVG